MATWTHIRTRPLSTVGMFWFTAERCQCGFQTTERLPGSNRGMNATQREQQTHEAQHELALTA